MAKRVDKPASMPLPGQLARNAIAWIATKPAGEAILGRTLGGYKARLYARLLADQHLRECFYRGGQLPEGYGAGLMERCVELPWALAHLPETARRVLDAGSTLNHRYVVQSPALRGRELHILTLAPEQNCY